MTASNNSVSNVGNLGEWLFWAIKEMDNYWTSDNKLAMTIQHDAILKLQRARELYEMEKTTQNKEQSMK